MIHNQKILHAVLLAFLSVCSLAAQSPPDPDSNPNVEDVTISKNNINKLEVTKNNNVKVKEVWKYGNGVWEKVWDLTNGGDFLISNNDTKESRIQNNPDTEDFNKDDKFRIVCEATDSHGNSTVIEAIKQVT